MSDPDDSDNRPISSRNKSSNKKVPHKKRKREEEATIPPKENGKIVYHDNHDQGKNKPKNKKMKITSPPQKIHLHTDNPSIKVKSESKYDSGEDDQPIRKTSEKRHSPRFVIRSLSPPAASSKPSSKSHSPVRSSTAPSNKASAKSDSSKQKTKIVDYFKLDTDTSEKKVESEEREQETNDKQETDTSKKNNHHDKKNNHKKKSHKKKDEEEKHPEEEEKQINGHHHHKKKSKSSTNSSSTSTSTPSSLTTSSSSSSSSKSKSKSKPKLESKSKLSSSSSYSIPPLSSPSDALPAHISTPGGFRIATKKAKVLNRQAEKGGQTEIMNDDYYGALHIHLEEEERRVREEEKRENKVVWVVCDDSDCHKWRMLPKGTKLTKKQKYFCGMKKAKEKKFCDELDDWLIRCVGKRGAMQLSACGVNTVETLKDDHDKLEKLKEAGFYFDSDTATINRYEAPEGAALVKKRVQKTALS